MSASPQPASMLTPPGSYRDDYATAYRARPMIPRQVRATAGSLETLITWNGPEDMRGVAGFRIYKDNENNLVEEIRDPLRRQTKVKLPGNGAAMVYVSAFTTLNRESPKIAVRATTNTDQLVVTGSGGATGGSEGAQPPGWTDEPSGGRGRDESFIY